MYKRIVKTKYGTEYKFKHLSSFYNFVKDKNFGEFGNDFSNIRCRYVTPINAFNTYQYYDPITYQLKVDHKIITKTEYAPVKFVVYDENNDVVPVNTYEFYINHSYLQPNPKRQRLGCNWSWQSNHRNYPGFRNGPVPHTGKKRSYLHYYRMIRTTQEKRYNYAHKDFVRGKRRQLPSAWDDLPREYRRRESWKNSKKRKQWM